jgi:hypothetical protein
MSMFPRACYFVLHRVDATASAPSDLEGYTLDHSRLEVCLSRVNLPSVWFAKGIARITLRTKVTPALRPAPD